MESSDTNFDRSVPCVPVLTGQNLEDGQQCLDKSIEVSSRLWVLGIKVESTTKHLHTQQCEDDDKQEEK